ncbi:DsrE family protein [Persephonella sp.]|uniref:DsrE family protein n=1 Tax=Persephonella sp. TaxID=2060922 RepID=UPI0018293338|nr:DsrE family protein [Persephonella sp.]HHG74430.1 sulfur reduction protein DsrE [Persephonella sp.]
MAKKNVVLIIKSNPFSWKAFEALRQAVGLSMEHNLTVVFMKEGVYTLTDWKPQMIGIEPIDKSMEALGMTEASVVAEEEAIRERGIKLKQWSIEIKIKPKEEVCELVENAEVVITW